MSAATAILVFDLSNAVAQSATRSAKMTPVAITDGAVNLKPDNTRIEFVGTHVGDDPKPRSGGFAGFKGKITMNADNSAIESIKIDIDINSIWTEFDNLTTHLKAADFFEVDKFGKSSFESTGISTSANGKTMVAGKLTLHGVTSEIMFPVKTIVNDAGLVLTSEFKLDRTQFGMDKMTSGVEKAVSLKVVVGQKTEPKKSRSGPGTSKTETKTTNDQQLVSLSVPNML